MNAIIAEYMARGCPAVFPPDIVRLDDVNVMVSDMGVMQNRSSENTATSATQWSYRELRNQYHNDIQVFAEQLYYFLQMERANFPFWSGSAADSEYNELLLRNNKELGSYLNTADSVRTFMGLGNGR
jgi:hypothetical protein